MRIIAIALLGLAAACAPDETANVMAPRANALTQEQVERLLGPEPGNAAANAATNEAGAEAEAINSAGEEQP